MNKIKQGVSETISLSLPIDPSTLVAMEFSFFQQGAKVITKDLESCEIDGQSVSVHLDQRETMRFSPQRFSLNFRGRYSDGSTIVMDDIPCLVDRSGYQEVL